MGIVGSDLCVCGPTGSEATEKVQTLSSRAKRRILNTLENQDSSLAFRMTNQKNSSFSVVSRVAGPYRKSQGSFPWPCFLFTCIYLKNSFIALFNLFCIFRPVVLRLLFLNNILITGYYCIYYSYY